MYRKKLLTYGFGISAIVAADFMKFLFFDFPALVNWRSFAHPAWVLATLGLFFAAIWADQLRVWQMLFKIHAIVAIIALVNHYLPLSSTITYNCLLFNFAFASLYFAIGNLKNEPLV